jgi:hypothetical protein
MVVIILKAATMNKQLTDEIYKVLVFRKKEHVAMFLRKMFLAGKEGASMGVKEAASLSSYRPDSIRKLAREGIYVLHFPTTVKYSRESNHKNRGRPESMIEIPTLEHLEKVLGCNPKNRKFTIDFETIKELKAEAISLPIKSRKGKEGDFGSKFLSKEVKMSPKTARKYLRMANRITPHVTRHTFSIKEFDQMPVDYQDAQERPRQRFWRHLEFGGMKFFYGQDDALEAMKRAGSIEAIVVVTTYSNHYKYVGMMTEDEILIEQHSVDSERHRLGLMTWEQYMAKYPACFNFPKPLEHREHYMLIKGMEGADVILHQRELEEQRQILKEASYRRL